MTAFRGSSSERKARASSTKVMSAINASISGKLPYTASMKSKFWAACPPTCAPPGCACAIARTRLRTSCPAADTLSTVGRTSINAVPPRCQDGLWGATTPCTPETALELRHQGSARGVAHQQLKWTQGAHPNPTSLQGDQPGVRVAGLRQRIGAGLSQHDRGGGCHQCSPE